jgi:AcrR family transcriptional regulator
MARRDAILEAGLHVFAEHGFEAARLDDVAQRAGVAKGTLYLYFKDKEALLEEIVRAAISPVIGRIEAVSAMPELSFAQMIAAIQATFLTQVLATDRKLILRLVLTEGPRFPRIAKFYYDEVVSRSLQLWRRLAEQAHARGEIDTRALAQFPQLIIAPALLSVFWDAVFTPYEKLDAAAMLDAHRDMLLRAPQAPGRAS